MNHEQTMRSLAVIKSKEDILPLYKNTPIGLLMEYHNLNRTFCNYKNPQMLIGMCMDHRKSLWIPENFAYIIRAGGANLFYHEFQVSYAIAVGGIKHIALIGHNHCGMVNLEKNKETFINGLVTNAGWEEDTAKTHFESLSPFFEIGNEKEFIVSEAKRLRNRYPNVIVAPLFYTIETGKLSLINE